jgi:CelD/BcsL family acetyltransferase involved in cellulose biosynthesis
VATVGPLVDKPAVQDAAAVRITNAVVDNADLDKKIRELLPARAKGLASTIAAGAEQAVSAAATKIVESDQFETLWKEINRRRRTRRRRAAGRGH